MDVAFSGNNRLPSLSVKLKLETTTETVILPVGGNMLSFSGDVMVIPGAGVGEGMGVGVGVGEGAGVGVREGTGVGVGEGAGVGVGLAVGGVVVKGVGAWVVTADGGVVQLHSPERVSMMSKVAAFLFTSIFILGFVTRRK